MAITEAGKEILLPIPVDVVKGDRDPASVRSAAGEPEDLSARSEPSAIDEPIVADVFVAIDEWLDTALEQIQISIPIEIPKAIEMAGGNVAGTVGLAEPIPIAYEAVIFFRVPQARLDRVEVDEVIRMLLIEDNEMESDRGAGGGDTARVLVGRSRATTSIVLSSNFPGTPRDDRIRWKSISTEAGEFERLRVPFAPTSSNSR